MLGGPSRAVTLPSSADSNISFSAVHPTPRTPRAASRFTRCTVQIINRDNLPSKKLLIQHIVTLEKSLQKAFAQLGLKDKIIAELREKDEDDTSRAPNDGRHIKKEWRKGCLWTGEDLDDTVEARVQKDLQKAEKAEKARLKKEKAKKGKSGRETAGKQVTMV